jgi:very-short-patch-repair endonuclease
MSGKPQKGRSAPRRSRVVGIGGKLQRALARLAARQHGVVTRPQLLRLGFSGDQLDYQLRLGRLRPLFRGVYVVGPVTPPLAREMGAVLACGEDARLSHWSAAKLWKPLPYPAQSGLVHVTVCGRSRGHRPGIRVHCVRALDRDETTHKHGIPVTTPTRTILDLAAEVGPSELEQLVAKAEKAHLTTRSKLLSLLAQYPRRPGTPALRALLERDSRPAVTHSRSERRLLALIRKADLPAPEVNFKLERYELDLYWPEHRLAIEVDDFHTHGSPTSFEADRRRDADLATQGIQVMRLTRPRIVDEPERTLALVARALALRDRDRPA